MAGRLGSLLVMAVVLLNSYSIGANCVERFVNYGSWPLLADSDFATYHRAQQPSILLFVVSPLVVSLFLQVVLLWNRSTQDARLIIVIILAASLVGAASTVLIQIPIHRKLDNGFSLASITLLLRTDWIRKAADAVRLFASIALLHKFMKH